MQIKLLIEGGDMKPGPALSQKLGPAGINIGQVIQRVNDETKNFNGLKVPVELTVNTSNKTFTIKVFSPPVSELIKKELGIEKGSGTQKKLQVANASIEQIISVAKTKYVNMLCKDLKAAVKCVVGTCVSLGILIENKPAVEIEKEIKAGKFDKEIKEERIITPSEKKLQIEQFFAKYKEEQEKKLKQEQEAKDAEAAAAAATGATPAEGEASATAAAPELKETAKKKEEPAKKKEEKK